MGNLIRAPILLQKHEANRPLGRCRARGGRASGGQAKIVREADTVLNTVLQADSETDPFLSAT
jgi:hypothetical protein